MGEYKASPMPGMGGEAQCNSVAEAKQSHIDWREQTNGELLDSLIWQFERKANALRALKGSLSTDFLAKSAYELHSLFLTGFK